MGYQTDFVGYLHITPNLSEREIEVLNGISSSSFIAPQRSRPRAVDHTDAVRGVLTRGAPRGHSNWSVCPTGCCLSYDGGDKANHMAPWLKFLMQTFLVAGATVSDEDGLEFFTCNHVLNGMVVGSRRDNRELYSITVRENNVEVELLWPGVPGWSSYPKLAYQTEIDSFREWVVASWERGSAD